MVKPLTFKGDKKPKKRKRHQTDTDPNDESSARRPDPSHKSKGVPEEAFAADEDQNWLSADVPTDIIGPVVIVLPSSPPTCIACDGNGKVFAQEIENLIEGDPATAEPHDVRQVWVATRVAGAEGINFKGHHGRYLSCDKYGILSANAPAVSACESFVPIPSSDLPSTFSFQVAGGDREAFLSIKEPGGSSVSASALAVEIRGDASSISFNTTCRVRMQARFKPKLKASKESKALEKISRKELEAAVGRRLEDHEVKRLKKARKEGSYHEAILNARVKGKHDKFAS
ncbi:fascin superfamily domain-containing protein [Histoplasma ohiense]|nr:fascin superfamily domain-containing protein [Histoplasma ohiense (nom. inval.)]